MFILLRERKQQKSDEFSTRAWGFQFSLAELGVRTERKGMIATANECNMQSGVFVTPGGTTPTFISAL